MVVGGEGTGGRKKYRKIFYLVVSRAAYSPHIYMMVLRILPGKADKPGPGCFPEDQLPFAPVSPSNFLPRRLVANSNHR